MAGNFECENGKKLTQDRFVAMKRRNKTLFEEQEDDDDPF